MDADQYRASLNDIEERLGELYRERRKLTEEYAEDHPAVLPAPRARTPTQERIARCPRCGMRSEPEALEK